MQPKAELFREFLFQASIDNSRQYLSEILWCRTFRMLLLIAFWMGVDFVHILKRIICYFVQRSKIFNVLIPGWHGVQAQARISK